MKNLNSEVYDMRTESITNPLGIDKQNPVFSWKLKSDRRGAVQTAYHITAAEDTAFLQIVWDTGKIESNQSVGIIYQGKKLKAAARYYWKVTIWDENNMPYSGDTAWFETGLMGTDASVWDGALWIGSPKTTVNTAALDTYSITVDFQAEQGNKAGFAVAAQNKDNYILLEADMDKRIFHVYEYCDNAWNGRFADGNKPTVNPLGNAQGYSISEQSVPKGAEHDRQHLELTVDGRDVTLSVNHIPIINRVKDMLPETVPNQPKRTYLMSIGFKQLGSRAVYSNLMIKNTKTGDVYQQDSFVNDAGVLSALGELADGMLVVENRFELICPVPAVNVKNTFIVHKKVQSARLYASARGFYNAYINGEKVGNNFFDPGFTDYRKRIQYQTFDVTNMLREGENMIGATIGKGHYSGYCGYSPAMQYGEQNSFIAKLTVTYTDGSQDKIITDGTWKFTDKGPVIDSDYFDGEHYDARLEFDGWGQKGYDDLRWSDCGVQPWPSNVKPTNGSFSAPVLFELSAQCGPAARIERELQPIRMTENPSGHYVYDFGQNMVGTIRLQVKGKRGTSLKLRYGEMCFQNGELYVKNLRSAANTDTYTLKGDPNGEIFIPSYTSHGFRYVEITGNGYVLTDSDNIISITGLVLSNIAEITGDFTCSNKWVNQLQSNIQWGQRGNSLLVLTDCPQRNERMGWTGDAQVFAGTAAYNMDVAGFTQKWLQDMIDGQLMYNKQGAVPDTAPLGGDNRPDGCAGWADAAVIVPWKLYQAYGETGVLEQCYEMMKQWIAYQSMDSRQNYGVRMVAGKVVPEQSDLASIPYIQVQQRRGDHLAYDESTPFILSATAYAAHVSDLMSRIADILGKKNDVKRYRTRFEMIKQAFCEAWVQEDGSIAYWGEMSKSGRDLNGSVINQTYYSNAPENPNHPSQTAYALAIDFGLIPADKMKGASKYFAQSVKDWNGHLSVGFLGISHLAPALSKAGLEDIAFALLEQEENPGWLYSVKNGATTIWERWNSYIAETDTFGDISMNSFNHYSYGAIGEWMYENILGIYSGTDLNEAGYKKFKLLPSFGGSLTYAKGWHVSPYGKIESGWEIDDGSFLYDCVIPPNSSAILYLPAANSNTVIESGIAAKEAEGVTYIGVENGKTVFQLTSGAYHFSIDINSDANQKQQDNL